MVSRSLARRAVLTPQGAFGGGNIFHRNDYATASAAPLDNSTPASVDSGTAYGSLEKVSDASNTGSIASGRFKLSGAAAATYRFEARNGNPINSDSRFAIHFLYNQDSGDCTIGLYPNNAGTGNPTAGIVPLATQLQIQIGADIIEAYDLTASTDYEIVIDYDGTATRWLIKGGSEYAVWTEIYRTRLISWGANSYFCVVNTDAVIEFDETRIERTYSFDTVITRYPTFYVSTSGADTFDPVITTSSGTATWQYGDLSADEATNTVSHAIAGALDMLVRLTNLAPANILTMNSPTDNLTGDIDALWFNSLMALTVLNVGGNTLSGDISHWVLPITLTALSVHANGGLSGDLSVWVLPSTLVSLNLFTNIFTGDLSGWSIPVVMNTMSINTNSFSGDISGWVLPVTMAFLYLHTNSFANVPNDYSLCIGIQEVQLSNNALSQAEVDVVIDNIYTNRAGFTDATPNLVIGGTNAAPSGTYQIPPSCVSVVDGKEQIYELVNDSCGDGHNTWTVSYTA